MWGEACSAMAARRRRRWASLAAALGAVSLLLLVAFYGGRLRCRHGYFHVVNNDYTHCHWEMHAIGGSAEPTINSQGNRFLAPTNPFAMEVEVTKRIEAAQTTWNAWNWRSEGDLLLNGAYFIPSGAGAAASYAHASSLGAKSSSMVGTITSCAGVLSCRKGSSC